MANRGHPDTNITDLPARRFRGELQQLTTQGSSDAPESLRSELEALELNPSRISSSGSVLSKEEDAKSRLLSIPAEIRLWIYCFCFRPSLIRTQTPQTLEKVTILRSQVPSLLLTCHLINKEATPVFYQAQTLVLPVYQTAAIQSLSTLVNILPRALVAYITSIRLKGESREWERSGLLSARNTIGIVCSSVISFLPRITSLEVDLSGVDWSQWKNPLQVAASKWRRLRSITIYVQEHVALEWDEWSGWSSATQTCRLERGLSELCIEMRLYEMGSQPQPRWTST